jgi:hemerythrin-like domain-containing protein
MSSHTSTLAQIVGPSLITIAGDASVEQALRLARTNQVHHLPVVDGSDLVGLMCTCDVHDAPPDSLVARWMSRPAVTLDASETLQTAAQTMKDLEVGSVVVTLEGQPRGIVTRGDLLEAQPSTEDILVNARCECCGLTRHLSTGPDGHTFCRYCADPPSDTQRSISPPISAREADAPARAPLLGAAEPHPLLSLILEHRLIGELAAALTSFAMRVECHTSTYDRADLASFARVFRELGDYVHHEKEETILLPRLVQLGFDWECGPLAAVRQDHCQERYLIDVLCQAAEQQGTWHKEERRRISATAFALGEFQREHLLKENTELFPAITERMSPSELRLLEGELHTFDVRIDRRVPRAELTGLAEDLIRRYLAPALVASVAVQRGLSTFTID